MAGFVGLNLSRVPRLAPAANAAYELQAKTTPAQLKDSSKNTKRSTFGWNQALRKRKPVAHNLRTGSVNTTGFFVACGLVRLFGRFCWCLWWVKRDVGFGISGFVV